MGLRAEEEFTLDDIMSYLNYHGSWEVVGKISFAEFESMVVRLLCLSEHEKLEEVKKKR